MWTTLDLSDEEKAIIKILQYYPSGITMNTLFEDEMKKANFLSKEMLMRSLKKLEEEGFIFREKDNYKWGTRNKAGIDRGKKRLIKLKSLYVDIEEDIKIFDGLINDCYAQIQKILNSAKSDDEVKRAMSFIATWKKNALNTFGIFIDKNLAFDFGNETVRKYMVSRYFEILENFLLNVSRFEIKTIGLKRYGKLLKEKVVEMKKIAEENIKSLKIKN
jgi:predicted transcriptional regulator